MNMPKDKENSVKQCLKANFNENLYTLVPRNQYTFN